MTDPNAGVAVLGDVTEKTLTVGGQPLTVRPLRGGPLPAMLKALAPFLPQARNGTLPDLVTMLTTNAEAVLDGVAAATGQTRAWVDALAMDDLANLASAVVEVNADFFIRRMLPALKGNLARLEEALKVKRPAVSGAGPTASSS